MKRIALAYAAGFFTVIALALYSGGDHLVAFGLKLAAFEQSYDWTAAPRATVIEASATLPARSKARR